MGNIGSSTPSYFNTPQTGAQYRVTPQNYRQILGNQADIVLKPEQMKDMFEKGYLDVQRQFTEQESNEGIFTIAAKAMAAFIGPSKSIGAITIDPKFLEMIKDPNAEIGFGYTRLRQETLTPLPYPKEPERPATPPAQNTPTLQQTDVAVTTPQQQTEEHRDQLVKFRKEQEQQTQTPGTPGSYMVERNSRQNNSGVTWNKNGGARQSEEFGTLVRKYEAEGAPHYWNTELVQDATWEGAYVEAATQDRDAAVRFQYATRGNIDMETARTELSANPRANTVATRQTEAMLRYVNQKTNSNLTMADVRNNPNLVREKMAQAYGFGSFSNVQAISQHARDFRAIGYISGENPKVATHQVGQMSTQTANNILRTQISGQSTKADGTSNFYDTIGMLSSRNVNQPGFDAFKPANATANTTLLDVYRTQTETTPIPDNAMADYQKLYNDTFKTNLSLDEIKAAKPTLQDMYALRASNFYATNSPGVGRDGKPLPPSPLPVTANNGRVTMNNPGRDTNRMLNVRLVLEANNGGDQVHRFGATEIAAVNARVTQNFTGSTLTLRNNLGQNISPDQLIQRLQINEQDSEAVDTAMVELSRTGEVRASGSNEVIAKFEDGVLKKPDGNGNFVPVKPEEQSAFLSQVAQQFTNPDGSYNTKVLDGGVGHGFVGGTTGTTATTRTQTPEVEVRASEMLQLADGKAPPAKVEALKASLGITGEISQQDLFKRVLTDAFGQSPEQATAALTGAQAKPTPSFSFPTPPASSNSGVRFTPPDPSKPGEVIKTESSSTTTGPSVESRTAALNANLNTMGELAKIKSLIPKDPNAIGQLKTQILADLDALERSGATTVKIGNPPTDTPISTVRASVTENFGKIEASVKEGETALRGAAVQQALAQGGDPESVDPSQYRAGLPTGTAQDAQFSGLPGIPPVPKDPTATSAANYAQSIESSVKAFSGQLREMVKDGDISTGEKETIQSWINTSERNLATSLGVDTNTLYGNNLAETLRGKGFSDTDINTISRSVDLLKDTRANVNLTSEARSFHRVLDNVRGLQQKLNEFEKVGVLRNAFVGEMKDLATNKPDKFEAVMRGAYNLPPKGQDPKADALIADLTTRAKEGKMPIPANISFVDGNTLHGANAAYIPPQTGPDGKKVEGTILLNRALLNQPAELSNALAEEMFHHLEGQTMAYRAEEALAKLPADCQSTLKAKSDAVLSDQQVAALTPDQKKAYDDYLKARSGTYDTVGDEGQAGVRAFREAQQGGSVDNISAVAAQGREVRASDKVLASGSPENRPTDLKGYDHGSVTLPDVGTVRAEFQSGGVRRGGTTGPETPAPPITPGETGGLSTPGINPHDTGRRYTEVAQVDNLPPTNDPIEVERRKYIQSLDTQLRTFQTTTHTNQDGSPMTVQQKEQKRQKLQAERDEVVQMNSVQFGQKYNVQTPPGSTHNMEQPPEDFWGKAKEMGGQAINGILQYLSTGAPGALCDQIASQIESVWKSFYANATQNSSAADRYIAEDVVQSGFDVGRDGNYEASRTNLINPQGKAMVGKSIQDYQQTNPGFRQGKPMWDYFAERDDNHRKAYNEKFK